MNWRDTKRNSEQAIGAFMILSIENIVGIIVLAFLGLLAHKVITYFNLPEFIGWIVWFVVLLITVAIMVHFREELEAEDERNDKDITSDSSGK